MNDRRERKRIGLYRSRSGMVLGVCEGLADYLGVQVKWVRIAAVIALIATGFWPAVAVYLLVAYFIKPEPVLPLETELEEEFLNSYASSRAMALRRLKRDFDHLDVRIQRMEGVVTGKEYSWEQRLNS